MKLRTLCARTAQSFCLTAIGISLLPVAQAQTSTVARSTVTTPVTDSKMITLLGNVRPEANAANDRGAVDGSMQLDHMLLQLKRPAEREAALTAKIESLHTPGSPDFHKWLTAEEIGSDYGPSAKDIAAVTGWLKSHGFEVNEVSKSGMVVDFSGTAAQLKTAFRTEMHTLNVRGASHVANMQNPQIPAALGELVAGVSSLSDIQPRPANKGISAAHIDSASKGIVAKTAAKPQGVSPAYTVDASDQLVVPDDLHTIYNFAPVYKDGITGKGETVVVIEDTNVYSTADWDTFRETFGLSKYKKGSFTQIHPGGCKNPGDLVGNDGEAILDAEYASAAAPNAAIVLASCADTKTTFGGLLAVNALINQPLPPPVISISYGECEAGLGAAGNLTYATAYQQASAEGVSVFVSSGDEGAASCDADQPTAQFGIAVSGFASTQYNVAVGGTDFGDTYAGTNSTYWKKNNNATFGSAKSYIPEIPWNDSCASTLITNTVGYNVPFGANGFCNSAEGEQFFLTTASGSGGPSNCAFGNTSPKDGTAANSGTCKGYPKPNYQNGAFGNPSDGVRDLPDVSLFAANGVWGHYYAFCYSQPANLPDGMPSGGAPCVGDPVNWSGAGGTSFAAPIVAGIQALVDQSTGTPQGNPNFVYYALAKQEYGGKGNNSCNSTLGNGVDNSCTFYDVTLGDMDVNCLGKFNCYTPSGTNGVLSVSSKAYEKAYNSNAGWDFATGLGTLNVNNLVKNWNKAFQ
ncbi:S53 family peptidase [Tunturiibacter lichenicola]|uniref:S53 family peptidase n=1 Tax=Tunturiibacter lichenicola TaxID=2051959 RepID=UPI0021B33DFC|nr:S53 family peptidase [Edaphobacter lichenicola]